MGKVNMGSSLKIHPPLTADADMVLVNRTFTKDGRMILSGTMPDHGALAISLGLNGTYTIPKGYHNGAGKVSQSLSSVFVDTGDANAVASQIINGATGYVKGSKVTGSMPVHSNSLHSLPFNGTYVMPAGYHNGTTKVSQSLAALGAQTIMPGTSNQVIAAGRYLTGAQTILGDADLVPNNIRAGTNIFGVVGTMIDGDGMFRIASGMGRILDNTQFTITGLSFQPKIVLINAYVNSPHWTYYHIIKYNKTALGFSDVLGEMDGTMALPWKIGNNSSVTLATALTFTTTGFYFKFPAGYQSDADRVRWIALG